TWHRLAERDAVDQILLAHPAPVLDQVALHVADGGDRASEPERPQLQEVEEESAKRYQRGRLGRSPISRPRGLASSRFKGGHRAALRRAHYPLVRCADHDSQSILLLIVGL